MDVPAALQNADLWTLHVLNLLAGNWVVDRLVHFVAGDRILTGFVFVLPYWYFWFSAAATAEGRCDRRVQLLAGLFSGFLAILIARLMADLLPYRTRPMFDHASGFVMATVDFDADDPDYENWSSFPSDTAAFAFALAFGLRRIAPRLTFVLVCYAVIVAGLFRDYLGIHYPSDSIVGGGVGLAAAMLATMPLFTRPLAALLRWEAVRPSSFYAASFLLTAEMGQMFDNIRRLGHALGHMLRHLQSGA